MTYSDIISKTVEVYVACGIHSFPIDCVDIIESYGYKVYTYSYIKAMYPRLYDFCRSYSADSFKHTGLGCVMYNDACSQGRILFSLAHEIGHIALGHVGEAQEYEAAADAFAGYLLAPCVMIDHYHCKNSEDVVSHFSLSTSAANIAWLNYRRWKRHAPCAGDTDLLNWILYLRRPVEITVDNMYRVNPFESVWDINEPITPPPNLNCTDILSHSEKQAKEDFKESEKSDTAPPAPLQNASPLPQKDRARFEKMRRYHRKRRLQIEKELEQVHQDMESLQRMDADFLGTAENGWLYGD